MLFKLFFKFRFFSSFLGMVALLPASESSAAEEPRHQELNSFDSFDSSPHPEIPKPAAITFSKSPTSVIAGDVFFGAEDCGEKVKYERRKIKSFGGNHDLIDDKWLLCSPESIPQHNELSEKKTLKPRLSQGAVRKENIINNPEEFERLPDRRLAHFWQVETNSAAVEDNREPSYLVEISSALEKRLERFSSEQEQSLETREDLMLHAHSLLFAMKAYYSSATFIAESAFGPASESVAGLDGNSAAWTASKSAAWYSIDWSVFWKFRNWDVDRSTDWLKNKDVDWSPDWLTEWEFDWSTNWEDADDAVWSDARDTAQKAVYSTIWFSRKAGEIMPNIGALAYRKAELFSLLYCLKKFYGIVGEAHKAASEQVSFDPENNIFSSKENWLEFRSEYFKVIRQDAKHFLVPWRTVLDRIASRIDALALD